ncbi:MAG: Uma2 family endonuclease [Deltaproteobacteria bacterium]|nr:MAG: Uma2 family endonuclease [Deltaproteobacteria bacterium]
MAAPAFVFPNLRQQLEDLPAHQVGEILAGELHVQPRPSGAHGVASGELFADVMGRAREGSGSPRGGWVFLMEPELHLGDDILVPDIAGWARERLPDPTAHIAFAIVPDWVCEVLSPSTHQRDRGLKADLWLGHGLQHLWLVDPTAELVEAFVANEGRWSRLGAWGGDDVIAVEPFPTLDIALSRLWGRELVADEPAPEEAPQ